MSRNSSWLIYVCLVAFIQLAFSAEPTGSKARLPVVYEAAFAAAAGLLCASGFRLNRPRPFLAVLAVAALGIGVFIVAFPLTKEAAVYYLIFPIASITILVEHLQDKIRRRGAGGTDGPE